MLHRGCRARHRRRVFKHADLIVAQFLINQELQHGRYVGWLGFVVTCRDVPEVVTQGETIEDAINQAEGALEAAIEMRIEDDMRIPVPSARKRGEHLVCVPVGTAMKAGLYVSN